MANRKYQQIILGSFALLFVMLFVSTSTTAKPKTKWNPGFIILDNNQKVEGEIQFVERYNAVVCQMDGKVKTFSVHNVKYFEYFDQKRATTRHFASFSNNSEIKTRASEFVEVITTGYFNVIRKGGKFYMNVDAQENTIYNSRWQILNNQDGNFDSVDYSSLTYFPLSSAVVRNFRKETLPLLSDHQEDVDAFISENNLKPGELVSQLYIMEFYNFLRSEAQNTSASIK